MDFPDKLFHKLTGRKPTDADVQRLYRAKDALGLADDDAIWLVFIALDYHQTLYDEIPSRIESGVRALLEETRSTSRKMLAAEARHAQRTLTEQVAASAQAVAGNMTRRAMWRAVGMTSAVMAVILAAAIGYVHTHLRSAWIDAAYKQGSVDTYKVIDYPLAKWALTDEGQLARVFAKDGTLDWANSVEGRVARALSDEGLLKTVRAEVDLSTLDDIAVVSRRDAEWLASEAGQRARARSDGGNPDWVDSAEGQAPGS